MKKIILLAAVVLCSFQCGGKSGSGETPKNAAYAPSQELSAGVGDGSKTETKIQPETRKIIKHADLRIESSQLDAAARIVRAYADGGNIYITKDEVENNYSSREIRMTIRVVNNQFDSLLANLIKLGDVKNQTVSRDDITEEYIDIEARMNSKKILEQRYLDLIKQAKNMKDIIEIENSLNEVREEIESAEGKLKYYDNRVDYSTIELNLFQNIDHPNQPKEGYFSRLWGAFANGFNGLSDGIVGIISVWHLFLFLALFIFLIYKFIKYLNKKQPAKKSVPPPQIRKNEEK